MKKQFLFLIILIFLIVTLATTCGGFGVLKFTYSIQSEELWLDDFASYDARWNWGYNAGTGYKNLTTINGYSVCEGGIKDASTSSEYSDCSLHHFINVGDDEPIRAEIRMRYTDRNGLVAGDQGKGTKGCGWWDGSSSGDNVAWFMAFSPESAEPLVGFRCQVRRGGAWYLNKDISEDVDMMEWHVYRIDMLSNGTFFYVDDVLVASTPYRPQGVSKLEAGWVDNGYAYYSNGNPVRGNLNLDMDEKMYIDWVRLSVPSAQDVLPPTTLHDYDSLWHNTDFTITLTAADDLSGVAETYYKINHGTTKNVSIDKQPIIATESANNTLEYWSVDNAGNEEIPHKFLTEIKLDESAPTCSIVINNGESETSSTSVALSLAFEDPLSGVYHVRYSNDGIWDSESWEAPSGTKSWTLPSGDGAKTVYYQVQNNAGLLSSTYSDTITLSTTVPTGSIIINDGAAFTTSTSVTLSLTYTAPGSNVSQVRYSNDDDWNTESWEAPAASKSWILTSGDESKTVYYQIKNSAGVVSSTYSDTIVLDTVVPTGSIVIKDGDISTSSTSVSLLLTANDSTSGVSQVRYSNDGLWGTETWESFSASKAWILAAGDGTKTVRYQIKDNAGLESPTYLDTIVLDTTAPTGFIIINNGDAFATSKSVMLTLTYEDATSGVSQVRYSNDGNWDSEAWEAPFATKSWTLTSGDGTKTVYYQIKDAAGLPSTTCTAVIILDTTPPTASIIIDNGGNYTNSTSVMLGLTSTDALSGVSQVRYSNDGVWDSESWEAPSGTKSWTLLSGDGAKTVYYQVKDNAGLVTTLNDSITLDMTKPTVNAGQNQMVDAGATVNFNASNSTDNIGIVSYAWNFGDDTTGTGISATHVYSNSGTYNVSLTVEDAAGNRDTQSVTVTVLYVIPEFPSVALLIVFIMVSSALTLSFRIKCKPSRQNV